MKKCSKKKQNGTPKMAKKKTQMAKKKKFFSKKKKFFSEKLDQEQPANFTVSTFLTFKSEIIFH